VEGEGRWWLGACSPSNVRTTHAQRRRSRARGGSSGGTWLGGLSTASLGEEWHNALMSKAEQSSKMRMEKRGHNEEGKTKSASASRV
jgi:hypothetical protein